MDIYLDSNATTAVLPQARIAALSAMEQVYGNPSSTHASGLRARALIDETRALARQVLNIADGDLLFTSGATEGIQTAVLSALSELKRRRAAGETIPTDLLYGATEHKAVPEALHHWNGVLGLNLAVIAIPVNSDGRHDLAWLEQHIGKAGLVCTMVANNETGVVSDLRGISKIVKESGALWLVDSVQALGKVQVNFADLGVDYAPFSGHKLCAPKGIGLLFVREGAPFTPLLAGGGQENGMRSGTENMTGIAALGAVLQALGSPGVFAPPDALEGRRERLAAALRAVFPGIRFNAAFNISLPTTLNFSVPGMSSKMLIDLFDASGIRVSGGSACSASKAEPRFAELVAFLRGVVAPATAAWQQRADESLLMACRRVTLHDSASFT
ncbi:cysteine desulfurase family protein [Ralstonia pseudosolanacearum]|uniref:cysteine desulfurase family protein n=1 Tax=Ralstonia pseudosolanacearum TaxID=1310165 RepID=UPI003D088D28